MKKLISILLTITLLFTLSQAVIASGIPSEKEEVVYGILNPDGSVESIYVVNIFEGGNIVDYGDYMDIRNLTTSENINQNGDEISVNTSAMRLYYQGTLKTNDLPWIISITYILDGTEIPSDKLAGKSGALEIKISVSENTDVNGTFFDNYALQISLTLDTYLCENIETVGATAANAGNDKQLTYTVFPGKDADISVKTDVHDFEMDAIAFAGIKLSMDVDIDENVISDKITGLTDAIKRLDDGAGDLMNGAAGLSDGISSYVGGIKTFADGLTALEDGVGKLNRGAASLKSGLLKLTEQNDTLIDGALAIQQSTFDSVNGQLSLMGLGLPTLTPDNYSVILTGVPGLEAVKAQLDGIVQFTQGIISYTGGVDTLGSGASDLSSGISQLYKSISSISSSADNLYTAGIEINNAAIKLRDGISAYKNGTSELKSGTVNIESEINKIIADIMSGINGNGDEVISFVSDKNTNITSVQFIIKTSPITVLKTDNIVAPEPERLNFWQKLMKLFGF